MSNFSYVVVDPRVVPTFAHKEFTEPTIIRVADGVEEIPAEYFWNTKCYSVELPNTIKKIGAMAFGHSSIVTMTIPASVTEMGNAVFYGCESLTTVFWPHTLKVIPYNTFYCCISLEQFYIPDGVTVIRGYAFMNCKSLKTIRIPETIEYIGAFVFDKTALRSKIGLFKPIALFEDGTYEEPNISRQRFEFREKKWTEKCEGQLHVKGYHVYFDLFALFNRNGGHFLTTGEFKIYQCKVDEMIEKDENVCVVDTFKTVKELTVKDIINLLNNN